MTIEDDATALAKLADPTFDPAQQAILATHAELNLAGSQDSSGLSQVIVHIDSAERIALEVVLPAPGYLVLSDAYYPGWKATVDDEPAEILRANVHFRAVFLSSGSHTVTFTYEPASYTVGSSISIVTSTVILIALVATIRRPCIADV
jgi:uncharacterized membrane protein YfhO